MSTDLKAAAVMAFAATFALLAISAANAQESASDEANGSGSTVIYQRDFFDKFNPVNANDMVQRIPGLNLTVQTSRQTSNSRGGIGNNAQRGLGSGENQILINGKRIAGKANEGIDSLTRIAANQVERIEIIRGTSGELDVRSSGEIINIVLRDDVSTASGSYKAGVTWYPGEKLSPGGSLSYSNTLGDFNYLASVEYDPDSFFSTAVETSRNPDGSLINVRDERQLFHLNRFKLNGNVGYIINNRQDARLNGLYEDQGPTFDRTIDIFEENLSGDLILTGLTPETNLSKNKRWEFGGDYEWRFDGGRFKVLGIINQRTSGSDRIVFDDFNGDMLITDIQTQAQVDKERIIRSSVTFGVASGHDIEIGAEGSQTILDKTVEVFNDETDCVPNPLLDPDPDCNFVMIDGQLFKMVDLGNPDSIVEEMRLEPFLVYNWTLTNDLSVETGVVFEVSSIDQTGSDVENSRSFFFVRPSVDVRYSITPRTQLRVSVKRDISQLDFSDFVTKIDFNDDDNATNSGNPNLAQEKAWKYEATLEHRIKDDGGVVSVRVFYEALEDVIDFIDVTPEDSEPDFVDSARGNIGDGKYYGIEGKASLRLGFLGLPGALITGNLILANSSVTDSFLMEDRRLAFKPNTVYSLEFRHDLTRWPASYGFDVRGSGQRGFVDIDRTLKFSSKPEVGVFAETRVFGNMTLRFEGRNIFNASGDRERVRFLGNIANGIVDEIEMRPFKRESQWEVSVRGTF